MCCVIVPGQVCPKIGGPVFPPAGREESKLAAPFSSLQLFHVANLLTVTFSVEKVSTATSGHVAFFLTTLSDHRFLQAPAYEHQNSRHARQNPHKSEPLDLERELQNMNPRCRWERRHLPYGQNWVRWWCWCGWCPSCSACLARRTGGPLPLPKQAEGAVPSLEGEGSSWLYG